MKKFTGLRLHSLVWNTGLVKLGLVVLLAGFTSVIAMAQPVNDGFANATLISGLSGTTNGDNNLATIEPGEPVSLVTDDNPYGVAVGASAWYVWTAPANGNVTFDTLGSGFDTILAVYTGSSVASLSQLAANDDISAGQTNSQTGFYAVANTTYFIAVYGFNAPPVTQGNIVLNWTMQTPGFSAGQFRLTSTSYTFSQNESLAARGGTAMNQTTLGARVSVTRVGGAVGRVKVAYSITNAATSIVKNELDEIGKITVTNTDSTGVMLSYTNIYTTNIFVYTLAGTNICSGTFTNFTATDANGVVSPVASTNFPFFFTAGNGFVAVTNADTTITITGTNLSSITKILPVAVPGAIARDPKNPNNPWDYLPAQGVLTFNDYEMTKDILITVSTNNFYGETPVAVQVKLDSAMLDSNELQTIPAPTLDSKRSVASVNILNVWQLPSFGFNGINALCPGTASYFVTNLVNFERSTLRVKRSAGNARIAVYRGGGTADYTKASTIYYHIDANRAFDDWNTFTLQSGSDYAIPDLATKNTPEGVVDFISPTWGSVTFPANSSAGAVQFINVPILTNDTVEFNKDFYIYFAADSSHMWTEAVPGSVSSCTVTILYDKEPAGAADRSYNIDNDNNTSPPQNPNPGANGSVFAVAVQPDGKGLIAGDFTSYDQTNSTRIARAFANGQRDAGFIAKTGLGADGFIAALALDTNANIFIGGGFSSFDGIQRNGIARLNPDGSLDTTVFKPGIGADGTVSSILIQPDGQILIAGNFTSYDNSVRNGIARLNPDGTIDPTFDPQTGPINDISPGDTSIKSLALQADGRIVIGGNFTSVDDVSRNYIARLNADGSLDTSFDPGAGANDIINSVLVDTNGLILAGGAFTQLGTLGGSQGIARLNSDGSVDTTFAIGSGANDIVYSMALQPDGGILLGGLFTSINQTRRVGIARLLPNGTVDTSFMDTAYNQFAGLINPYYNPDINALNPVYSIALQADGNVLIGGLFSQIGGGFSRADIRPRSNVARLIGGATPGPGNIGLSFDNYSASVSSGTQTNLSFTVTIDRSNGSLGPAAATLQPVTLQPGPGAAVYGTDFIFSATPVLWGTTWSDTWMLSDGVSGANYSAKATIINNTNTSSSLNLQLTQPISSDIFFLGGVNKKTSVGLLNPNYTAQDGENIPLGVALGRSLAPLSIIRNNLHPGVLSFSRPIFSTNENSIKATISVTRTGGSDGTATVHYKTVDGTAHAGTDYTAATGTLTFGSGITNQTFNVSLIDNIVAQPDRYFNVQLYTPGTATLGLTNAQVIIIDNDYSAGHVFFDGGIPVLSVMTYGTNENQGTARITVTRQGGNTGQLVVSLSTGAGTAVNGINYIGFTNQITWNNGISGPQTVLVPILSDGVVTSNLTVNLRLFNATVNGAATAQPLGGVFTNALLTITNIDAVGVVQFSVPSYSFNENGGQAIIPLVRTGGSAGSISVNLLAVDGTALLNTDYLNPLTTSLTFTNGEVSKSFRLPIVDNLNQDGNRSLSLVLTNVSPTNAMGNPNMATVNIVDDETYNHPAGSIDSTYSPLAGLNGPVFALALQPADGKLVVGGSFTFANGVGRRQIARLNVDGTLDAKFSSYLPSQGASDTIRAVAVQTDGRILVGGFFTNFNGANFSHIARLNYNGSLDSSFSPGSGFDNPVYAVAEAFMGGLRKLYIGGAFANANGTARNAIARLNDNGSVDTAFNPGTGANGTVFALAVQNDGKVLIGGDFTSVNGATNFNHVARLNADGSLDSTFNPAGSGADSPVHAIAVQLDGRILIGGLFTNYNGVSLNHIARLNSNGSLDAGFNPGAGANGDVQTISLQTDTRILLGGSFTLCNGVTRNHITRLNPDGTVDQTINFGLGADGFVAASVIQADASLIIGGGFLNYGGVSHPYLARIFGGSLSGSGAVEFSSANYQAHETSANVIITVMRTGGTSGPNGDGSGDILVPFTMSGGSAVAGINYFNVATNLDFPAGEVAKTVVIPLIDDHLVTSNLTVGLALGTPTLPTLIGNQPTATLTILNDDSAVSFSAPTYTVPKNTISGAATIHVSRFGSTAGTCTVDFATTTNGTAIIGTDYFATNQTVIFNPGQTDVIVQVPIINNGLAEGNTTIGLLLTNAVNTLLSSPSNATLTIVDTVSAPGQLSFANTNYVGNEGSPSASLTVLRAAGSSGSVSVSYATVPGTALPTVNYTAVTGTLTFGDGETTKIITVPLLDNTLVQGTTRFTVVLSNPTGGAALTAPTNATVTITDNDVGISYLNATNYVSETNSIASILVQRVGLTNNTVQATYFTINGTAFAGTNYVASSGTLVFTPGETLKAITLPLLHDSRVTGDLTFSLGLTNITPGAQLIAPSNTLVIVQDGDAGLSFTNSASSVAKNVGTLLVPVICSNTNVEPVSVNYSTADGSALANIHYVPVTGTLTFSNGVVTNYFVVPIINNGIIESNRSFTVSLSNPTSPGQVISPGVQTITIVEANSGFKFSSPSYTILRSGVASTITVLRVGNVDNIASVYFSATNGTGVNGLDYVATNGLFVFSNGVTSQTFRVPVIVNTVVQPDKTVLLQLFNPSNSVLSAPSAATLTIHDTSGSLVVPAGSTLTHEGFAPANGIIDPGENVTLLFALRASGGTNIPNVTATLLVTNGITSPSPVSQNYGALVVNGPSVSRAFSFTASGTNSQPIAATFQIGNGLTNIGTAVFTYTLGTWTTVFSNTTAIIINDNAAANPYPSMITVTGLGGSLVKASVTFTNMSHKSPGDIDALLVSPSERDTMLMGQAGGQNNISHVTLTFDDAATNSLPQNGQIVSGTNKPTSFAPPLIKFP